MTKKLSVAFVWHMHQPIYKDYTTGEYLMPWVRLHAVKDYLDMILILEKFPKIKQTFNLVPALIDQLLDYGHNNTHDIHSRLTISDISKLTDDDKAFILDHFFDANYVNMILPYEPYKNLYEKRFQEDKITIDSFTDQEYSDILAWFNLIWFDPHWRENIPELEKLFNKGTGYSLKDRKLIIEMQREIIRSIIPKYKELYEKGQIEISTSPYYHPIMPIVINTETAKISAPDIHLPETRFGFLEDIKSQLEKSVERFKEIFGRFPDGIWPSEHCICPKTLELLCDLNIKWTITDEGNLAKTLGKEFVRDFHGILQDPYDLCRAYQLESSGKKISALFRNSVLADLVGFEYGNHDPKIAANDLYERIKTMQSKLQDTPEKNHIVTIALDGENCWESYKEDGKPFLFRLYELLSDDEALEVTTISDFISKVQKLPVLKKIHPGSWINRNFNLWIGDPTKNIAWDYLHKTRQDLISFTKEKKYPTKTVEKAWEEIYISEGSDWFWWFGEPNDSGQDDMFDRLFRMHLKNVYKILNKPIPEHLDIRLDLFSGRPSKIPSGLLKPSINGIVDSDEEWHQAGCIEIPQGPMYQSDKLLRRIFFGYSESNIYLRFDINKMATLNIPSEIYVYFYNPDKLGIASPIRLRSKGQTIFPAQRYPYAFELEIPIHQGNVMPPVLSEAMESCLWKVKGFHSITSGYNSVLEIAIPFADLNLAAGQEIHFMIITSKSQILQEIIPQSKVLSIKRPHISDAVINTV